MAAETSNNGQPASQGVDARMDYGFDWSDWLAQSPGDAIVASTWSVAGASRFAPDASVLQAPELALTNGAFYGSMASVWVEGGGPGLCYTLKNIVVSQAGRRDARTMLLKVVSQNPAGSALFKNRALAIAELRRDRLALMASNLMPGVVVSDDYLWDKVLAAEAYVSSMLRVKLAPTRFFPIPPTSAELAEIGDMAWEIEQGYDYESSMFERDKWGYLVTRQRPLISVSYMRLAYPTQTAGFFELPLDWLRLDHRAGHVRIVPSGMASMMGMTGFGMGAMMGRSTMPDMVQLSYTAGLPNAARDYPELLDVIKKKAILSVLADAYLPQSGSISADGLSQSASIDVGKYSDAIDDIIQGPKGSNGGLMTKIHGIRAMVL